MPSEKAVKEFQKIYRERFKEELSDAEASRLATSLLNLYRAIYGLPYTEEEKQIDINQNHEKNHS